MNREPSSLKHLLMWQRAAAANGKPMGLGQAAAIVVIVSSIATLTAGYGIHEALVGQSHQSLHDCIAAFAMLISLPIHVYNFLRVKRGERVINPFSLVTHTLGFVSVPLFIKVTLVGALTLLVAFVSYFSLSPFYLTRHVHFAPKFVMVTLGFNSLLWLIVAFAWYLFVIRHEHRPPKTGVALEQGKNVWPPAPTHRSED